MKRRSTGLGASSLMTDTGGKRLIRRRSPSLDMDRGVRKRHRSFSPRSREDSPMDDRVGKPIIDKQHHRSHSGERYESSKYDKYDKRQTGLTPEQRYAKFDSYEKYARYQKEMEKERANYNESKLGKFDRYGKYEKESFEYSLRIGNLNYNISEKETASMLFQEFKRFGFIDVKVLGQRHDRHAFVNFIRYEDAKRARVELQNATLFGRGMHIEWSKSTLNKKLPEFIPSKRSSEDHRESAPLGHSSLKDVHDLRDLRHAVRTSSTRLSSNSISRSSTSESSSKTSVVDPSACRTLFVGSLNISITERELRDLFSQYGRIESVDIKHQHAFRTAYAFIKFMTINDAINAKNDMHGKVYNSMELKVGFGRGTQPGRVWCGNITSESDIGELEKTFDRFGTIRYVDYHEGDDHAFFHFDDMDAAQTAIESLTKYRFRNSGLALKIDWARGPKRESSEHESEFRKHTYENDRREILYEKNPVPKKRHSMPEESYTPRKRVRDDDYGAPSSASSTRHRSSPSLYQKSQRKKPSYSTSNSKSSYDDPSSYSNSQHYSDYDNDPDVATYKKRDHHSRSSYSGSSSRSYVRDRTSSTNHHDISKRDSVKPSRHDSGYVEANKKEILENNSSSGVEVHANGSANPTAATLDDKAASVASSGGFVEDEVKPDSTNPETLSDLAKHFPVAWKGSMVLKNTAFPTRMHLIGGDPGVAELLLRSKDEHTAVLKISQRLRLEGPRLDEVNKRIQSAGPGGHCLLLALSGPTPSQSSPERQDNNTTAEIQQTSDENLQFRPLRSLVTYLKQKQAAGIVGLNSVDNDVKTKSDSESSGVLHAFPPCDFSQAQLCRVAPSLGQEPCKEDHIVVVVVRGSV